MSEDHKQKKIVFENQEIEVDEKLAKLVFGLLEHGYTTALSCQNNNGKIWLYFVDNFSDHLMRDALRFHPDLFEYLSGAEWDICYNEETRFIGPDEVEGTGRLEYGHSLRFDADHLKEVEEMFFELFERIELVKWDKE